MVFKRVEKEKEQVFLQVPKLFDFVKVESKEELLRRFIQNAPTNVPLSETDVVNEVMEHRFGKKQCPMRVDDGLFRRCWRPRRQQTTASGLMAYSTASWWQGSQPGQDHNAGHFFRTFLCKICAKPKK